MAFVVKITGIMTKLIPYQPGFTIMMENVIICVGGLQNTACFSNMLWLSESSSEHFNLIGCIIS